jgi:hypothetical protein
MASIEVLGGGARNHGSVIGTVFEGGKEDADMVRGGGESKLRS